MSERGFSGDRRYLPSSHKTRIVVVKGWPSPSSERKRVLPGLLCDVLSVKDNPRETVVRCNVDDIERVIQKMPPEVAALARQVFDMWPNEEEAVPS